MKIWQSDLSRFSSSTNGDILWLLLICNQEEKVIYQAQCKQSEVNADWLTAQLQQAMQQEQPDIIQIFRPQIVGLYTVATDRLNVSLETTRRTPVIKALLRQYLSDKISVLSPKKYFDLNRQPPQNLPEYLWGENWSFVSISAENVIDFTKDKPIPFCYLPESLLTTSFDLKSTTKVPGIVIYGGKKSLTLGRWLAKEQPVSLNYIPTEIGKSGGLVLESGLADRWIVATFDSETVAQAAKAYEQKKQESQGLHFLLLQPDDSGMTYTGFWLLKDEQQYQ